MISPELSQKRLEILREMLPALSRVGVLWCGPGAGVGETEWAQTQAAASVLKVQLASLVARGGQELASVFASAARQRLEAIIVLDCSQLHPNAARIAELALENRLPGLSNSRARPTRPTPAGGARLRRCNSSRRGE